MAKDTFDLEREKAEKDREVKLAKIALERERLKIEEKRIKAERDRRRSAAERTRVSAWMRSVRAKTAPGRMRS